MGGNVLGIQRTPLHTPESSTGSSFDPDRRTANGSIVRHVMLINWELGRLADKRGDMLTFGNAVGGPEGTMEHTVWHTNVAWPGSGDGDTELPDGSVHAAQCCVMNLTSARCFR